MSAQLSSPLDFVSEVLKTAKSFIPLSCIQTEFLEDLLKHSKIEFVCAGEPLFSRGDDTPEHYFLVSGRLRMLYASGFCESQSAGKSCSALADEWPRPCDCVAETDSTVLVVDADQMDRMLSWSQISEYAMSMVSADRYLNPTCFLKFRQSMQTEFWRICNLNPCVRAR